MARFTIDQKIEYKTWDGRWESGIISEGPDAQGDYIIDATIVEYRPEYVTRTAGTIREAR